MNANTMYIAIAALMATALIVVWVQAYSDPLRCLLARLTACLPFVGLCDRLGRNPDLTVLYDETESDRVTKADVQLAAHFAPFIGTDFSTAQINNRLTFARLAGDFDVHDTGPPILMTLILILGYGESLMVPLVLGGHVQADLSRGGLALWAPWIGLVVAVLSILGAETAGMLYRRGKAWAEREAAWRRAGRPQSDTLKIITPDMPQDEDQHDAVYLRFKARVQRPSLTWAPAVIMATLLVIGLSVLAVRFIDLQREGQLIQVVTSSPLGALLEVLGQSLAMLVLLLLYIGVQVLGFAHGYRHAYNSPSSRRIFKELFGMRSVEAYQRLRNTRLALVGNLLDRVHARQELPGHRASATVRQVYTMIDRESSAQDIIARVRAPMPSPAPMPPMRSEP